MTGYHTNIDKVTQGNGNFCAVLFTGPHSQLVVMLLKPGEDFGLEMYLEADQFIRVEAGYGVALLDGKAFDLADGSLVVIPAGTEYKIKNTASNAMLKLYLISTPPEHPDGIIYKTKTEAEALHP
jgi:mannose-6-phosphate isomerase-like protein (cupin superfamily)